MKTTIEINEKLLNEAMHLGHSSNKEGIVELALEYFVASLKRKGIKDLFGKVKWEGDLRKMRQ